MLRAVRRGRSQRSSRVAFPGAPFFYLAPYVLTIGRPKLRFRSRLHPHDDKKGKTHHENRTTRRPRQPKRLRHPLLRKTRPLARTAAPRQPAPLPLRLPGPRPANPFCLRNGFHSKRDKTLPKRHQRKRSGRPALEKTGPPQTSRSRANHAAFPPPEIPPRTPPALSLLLPKNLRHAPKPQPQPPLLTEGPSPRSAKVGLCASAILLTYQAVVIYRDIS